MCGIVAVFGKVGLVEEKVFCDLLQVDVIRGFDSTGIAAIRLDGSAKVLKDTVLPTELLMRPHVRKLFNKVNKGYIGHNRAATKGKVNAVNAHPFVAGHIVGVHNGTLEAEKGFENAYAFETDSEAVFDNIRHKGIEDTWKKLNGAASLVWWDAKLKTFNFIRNMRRPLHFAYTTDKETVFVASEAWMLEGCVGRRAGIQIEEVKTPKIHNHFIFQYSFAKGLSQTGGYVVPYTAPVIPYSPPSGAAPYYPRGKTTGNVWENGKFVPRKEEEKDKEDPITKRPKGGCKPKCSDGMTERKKIPFSIDKDLDAQALLDKPMTEKNFHKQYKQCTFCRSALDYETSMIVDRHNCACSDCIATSEHDNITISGGM